MCNVRICTARTPDFPQGKQQQQGAFVKKRRNKSKTLINKDKQVLSKEVDNRQIRYTNKQTDRTIKKVCNTKQ